MQDFWHWIYFWDRNWLININYWTLLLVCAWIVYLFCTSTCEFRWFLGLKNGVHAWCHSTEVTFSTGQYMRHQKSFPAAPLAHYKSNGSNEFDLCCSYLYIGLTQSVLTQHLEITCVKLKMATFFGDISKVCTVLNHSFCVPTYMYEQSHTGSGRDTCLFLRNFPFLKQLHTAATQWVLILVLS